MPTSRKAMQLVMDAGEVVSFSEDTGNLPAQSLFPTWLSGIDGPFRKEYPVAPQRIDVEEARRHLALAKQELGIDKIPPLSF
jgi:oligopeptide transport system substrate-binding protein